MNNMNTYKVNQSIVVRYRAVGGVTGITDLYLTPTNPSGIDGTPVLMTESSGLYSASFTPNVVGRWLIKISSVTNPENIYSQSYLIGDTENPLDSINTRVGEVQVTPTSNTLLGRLKDIYDKLVVGITGSMTIKDGTGNSYLAKVDSQGRLYTYIPPSQNNITIQIMIDDIITPFKALQWNDLVSYTVPDNYDLNCIVFDAYDSVNNGKARAVIKRNLGSFVMSTGIFTDLNSFVLPRYGTKLYAYITSAVGGTNNTITITYINSLGIAGRISTIVLKSNAIGERIEIPLQSGDSGILDVTNITQSITEAGAFTIEAVHSLFQNLLPVNGVLYQTIAPLSSIVVPAGETVYLQYNPSNGSTVARRVSIVGALVPR